MYRSVMVPLDRSSFAEQALPMALAIARRAKARLDLAEVHALYSLEDPTAGWVPFEKDRDNDCRQQEQRYLDATAKRMASAGAVTVTSALLPGSTVLPATVADSILQRVRTGESDLIVMATHGLGALARFCLGSVADEMIRRAMVPVLLVRPGAEAAGNRPEPVLNDILVPLDGSALAEQALDPALELARAMGARCCLLRVVESGEAARAEAEAYLEPLAGKAREQGLPVRTRVVVARHAPDAILEEARAQGSNLIALATHGRSGITRMMMGSVADTLVRTAPLPVLVCRANRETASRWR